jgi:hypothetical protein
VAVCEHLIAVEQALAAAGYAETFRGQPWSDNCREWVYFDTVLDLDALRRDHDLAAVVEDHRNRDPKSGTEQGLVCTVHHDGVIGRLPEHG